MLGKILASDYSDNNIIIDNPDEVVSAATDEYKTVSLEEFLGKLGTTQAKYDEVISHFDNTISTLVANKTLTAESQASNIAKTINNYSGAVTNNTEFNGGITVQVLGSTTQEMLESFAKQLSQSLSIVGQQAIYSK